MYRKSCIFALVLLLGSLTLTATATANQDERFDSVIAEALRAYNEGNYDRAVTLYFEAKVIHDLAEIDYSIARSYHNLGNCEAAGRFYQRALDRGDDLPETYRGRTRDYLANLDQTCVPKEVEVVTPTPPTTPTEPPPPQQLPPPVESGGVDWLSIGVMAGGGALLLTGLGIDLASGSLVDEHKDLHTNTALGTDEERRAKIKSIEDDIATRRAIVFALYGVGGAALITGVVLAILRMDSEDDGSAWTVQPALQADGAGLFLHTRW